MLPLRAASLSWARRRCPERLAAADQRLVPVPAAAETGHTAPSGRPGHRTAPQRTAQRRRRTPTLGSGRHRLRAPARAADAQHSAVDVTDYEPQRGQWTPTLGSGRHRLRAPARAATEARGAPGGGRGGSRTGHVRPLPAAITLRGCYLTPRLGPSPPRGTPRIY